MIQSVNNYPVSQLFDIDTSVIYTIPKYQREYTWNKTEWEELFDDIWENEDGYFLGSIICINQAKDALKDQSLELVDGQQRLTSISLLFAAIYEYLQGRKDDLNDDQKNELANLKKRLIHKKKNDQVRIELSYQNQNYQDFCYLLSDLKLLSYAEQTEYAGNRKIWKAFRYFQKRFKESDEKGKAKYGLSDVFDMLDKLGSACLVKIEVGSHGDAFILFESLNNRGVPLTVVDLVKNKLLSKLEKSNAGSIKENFDKWTGLLKNLTEDYVIQERYFRQYYNAFKDEVLKNGPTIATRSNVIRIYEKMIDQDAPKFFERFLNAGAVYSEIINTKESSEPLKKHLIDLSRISGVPSYLLLLYLKEQSRRLNLSDKQLSNIAEYLVLFFVRRNLTDKPPTRDLTPLFMQLVQLVKKKNGNDVVDTIKKGLFKVSADDAEFKKSLNGSIYIENTDATRFILCMIEENERTKEHAVDLWAMQGKQYVWTIEHIFPQGENIPKSWIDTIANGDSGEARRLQSEYVHRLGNLTISGYNSNLGNKSFDEKRDRKDKGKYVGYKNGLWLNSTLCKQRTWTIQDIENRTVTLVDKIMVLCSLNEKKKK